MTIVVTGGAGFIGANFVYLELKEHPEDLSANLALSSLLYRAEQTQDAVYYLKSALFYYPENPTATKRLAALGKK